MVRIHLWLIIAGAMCLILSMTGCTKDETVAAQGEGVINGIVIDAFTGGYLADVSVQAQSVASGLIETVSDAKGSFRVTFPTDSLGAATLLLRKTGYRDTSLVVLLRSGTVVVINISMSPKSVIVPPGGGGTGAAQTIAFMGAVPSEVSVYGVGGKETSILGWEVRDSLGLPIDAAHAVQLVFSSQNGPGGGEYISPPDVKTNQIGQAFATFNAGTRSGVVQVIATATVGGRTLTSSPVRLVINGGFPVQSHFSIAPGVHNFPALGWLGKTNGITVLLGDKYSNPVAPGTAVYFRSSAGVVQPTVFTNKDGFGTVTLYSGNPEPFDVYAAPGQGDGYHYVVARTLGQGGVAVEDSTLILWSGAGQVSNVSPATFDIANAGSQTFNFRVSDALGHPLAAGTNITVTANIPPPPTQGTQQNQVTVLFGSNGSIVLPDLLSAGAGKTDFTLVLKDGTWSITDPTPVSLTINVTGPNISGALSYTLGGLVR
jgi:hypothetical protein